MIARLARVAAVAIAVAAAVDPSWTVTGRGRGTVSVIEPDGSRIAARLEHDYVVIRGYDAHADAFVVAGLTYPAVAFPADARIATVALPSAPPAVRIADVDALAAVPAGTIIRVDATLAAGDHRPATSTVTARIHGVAVARAEHAWNGDDNRWRAPLDIVPIGEPPWIVDVSVDGCDGCATSLVVDRAARLPVIFFEPRPSWTTTFVRRALERDPRFAVDATTRLGDISASAVVVGGLDRVTDEDAARLERFARDRGGAVVLLPDARVPASSAVTRLIRGRVDDRDVLLDRPAALSVAPLLPRLAASEMLTFANLSPAAHVFARTSDASRPVIWTTRVGEGRVLVSGALDAWRFRADRSAGDFDRFWRSVIGAVALATPPEVEVVVSPAVARPMQAARVRARVRTPRASGAPTTVSALLANGEVVRLWPDAEAGSFSGAFIPPARPGASRVAVTATAGAAQTTGSAPYVVSSSSPDTTYIALSLLSAAHHGPDVHADQLADLDRWLRATVAAPVVRATRRPMRSPWWMLPFCACLTIDWWITSSHRRRR